MKNAHDEYGVVTKECENALHLFTNKDFKQALKSTQLVLGHLRNWYEHTRCHLSPNAKDSDLATRSQLKIATLCDMALATLHKLHRAIQSQKNDIRRSMLDWLVSLENEQQEAKKNKQTSTILIEDMRKFAEELSQDPTIRVRKMMDFFAVELDMFKVSLPRSAEKGKQKVEERDDEFELSSVSSINAPAKTKSTPQIVLDCIASLKVAVTTDFKGFRTEELRRVADAHTNARLHWLMVQHLLEIPNDDALAERIRLAVDLLWKIIPHYGHPSNVKGCPPETRETERDVLLYKQKMVNRLNDFLNEPEESAKFFLIKRNIIRACIEQKLRSTVGDRPWQLGWAGSRHRIVLDGKTHCVPKGIWDLYQAVATPQKQVNWEQVSARIERAKARPSPVGAFLLGLFGCGRRQETQQFYEELANTANSAIYTHQLPGIRAR